MFRFPASTNKVFIIMAFAVTMTIQTTEAFTTTASSTRYSSSLFASSGDDKNNNVNNLFKWADTAKRTADSDENLVELMRPLGLILKEDEQTKNVYVETVAPKGNAARTGKIKEGDIVTMCSATFGDDMWSTRGVGLTRVLAAIRVRAGPTVKLVVESPSSSSKKKMATAKQLAAQEDARKRAQEEKDRLLGELEESETKIRKKNKLFGLF